MKLSMLLMFFLVSPFIIHAQTVEPSNIDSLADNFLDYLGSFKREKIFIQTDRQLYSCNETIHFKAFLVDSVSGVIRTSPKRLYIDLVDEKDSVLKQLLLNNARLETSGGFVLNDSLKEGYYWIRAYTKNMIPDHLNEISVLPLFVVNPLKEDHREEDITTKTAKLDSSSKPIVQIFPEGGAIISGINSTVALRITDEGGNPLKTSGIIKDNADSVYATFNTNSAGLTKFSFYPIWYHWYSVCLLKDGKYDSVAVLPPIDFYSGQLAVLNQNDSNVKVRVTLEDSLHLKDDTTYLLALSGDSICYSAIGKGMYDSDIPLNNFSHGISRLLLFNNKEQFLSERDIYIKKENFNLSVVTDKENYGPRENVRVNLNLTDKNNNPEIAALTFDVTDLELTDTTINPKMWNDSLSALSAKDVDLVMLTQKSEFNKWKRAGRFSQLISDSSDVDKSNYFLTLGGRVVDNKNEPFANKIVTVFCQQINLLNTDTTDTNGRFLFFVPDYNDSTRFNFQVSNLKGKKEEGYKIIYDTFVMPHFSTPSGLKKKFAITERIKKIKKQLSQIDTTITGIGKEWLKPVIINRRKEKDLGYDKSKRASPFSYIITHDMLKNGANMVGNALLMVPGAHSTGNSIAFGGPSGSWGQMSQPLLVLDGAPVDTTALGSSVLDYVNSIPVNTIDFIEVLKGPEAAIYGMEGGNGVILINTRNQPSVDKKGFAGLASFYPRGFSEDKLFYMPDYNDPAIKKSKFTDLRATIYWNGNAFTDEKGNATFNFFTADTQTTYLVTITGFTINGEKIYKTFTINRN
ncbi:MAG: MG2 domain-containing protein [Ginsengibacter sp.]